MAKSTKFKSKNRILKFTVKKAFPKRLTSRFYLNGEVTIKDFSHGVKSKIPTQCFHLNGHPSATLIGSKIRIQTASQETTV